MSKYNEILNLNWDANVCYWRLTLRYVNAISIGVTERPGAGPIADRPTNNNQNKILENTRCPVLNDLIRQRKCKEYEGSLSFQQCVLFSEPVLDLQTSPEQRENSSTTTGHYTHAPHTIFPNRRIIRRHPHKRFLGTQFLRFGVGPSTERVWQSNHSSVVVVCSVCVQMRDLLLWNISSNKSHPINPDGIHSSRALVCMKISAALKQYSWAVTVIRGSHYLLRTTAGHAIDRDGILLE